MDDIVCPARCDHALGFLGFPPAPPALWEMKALPIQTHFPLQEGLHEHSLWRRWVSFICVLIYLTAWLRDSLFVTHARIEGTRIPLKFYSWGNPVSQVFTCLWTLRFAGADSGLGEQGQFCLEKEQVPAVAFLRPWMTSLVAESTRGTCLPLDGAAQRAGAEVVGS